MKIPKKINKSIILIIIFIIILTGVLICFLGIEKAKMLLGIFSNLICIIGLPAAVIKLRDLIITIDEGKLITRTLIEARENDKKEWEERERLMRQNIN